MGSAVAALDLERPGVAAGSDETADSGPLLHGPVTVAHERHRQSEVAKMPAGHMLSCSRSNPA